MWARRLENKYICIARSEGFSQHNGTPLPTSPTLHTPNTNRTPTQHPPNTTQHPEFDSIPMNIDRHNALNIHAHMSMTLSPKRSQDSPSTELNCTVVGTPAMAASFATDELVKIRPVVCYIAAVDDMCTVVRKLLKQEQGE